MKVLYVTTESPSSIGVRKKIYSKIDCLNDLGVDTNAIYFSENIPDELNSSDAKIKLIKFVPKKLPGIFNRRFFWQFQILYKNYFFYKALYKSIKAQGDFDFFIFRYPTADLNFLFLIKKLKGKVILEHNSKELEELKAKNNFFLYKYYYWSEKRIGPLIIKNAKGIIGVTNEITNYEIKRSGRKSENCTTISNGFNVESVHLRNPPQFDGKTINLLFLIGSAVTDWYGIDRLVRSVAAYKGDVLFKVYIVGNKFEKEMQLVRELGVEDKFIFTGYLETEKLAEMFDKCHIGVAALTMHKIGLTEAAALKVKEYMARGIPFILGYSEVDLIGKTEEDLICLKLDNTDALIDMNKIVEFTSKCENNKKLAERMRVFAKENVDYSIKALQFKKFLTSLK
jgi:glycosyltransferase involved in cell wall biosynthesis